jgi:hypothetical protein
MAKWEVPADSGIFQKNTKEHMIPDWPYEWGIVEEDGWVTLRSVAKILKKPDE